MPLPRIFISTDLRLSSPELDDAQSLIHALMYQDEMDIVGISATASKWGIQDGLVGDVKKILDVYGKDQAKLQAHSDDFKTAAELRSISWQGATDVAPSKGFSNATDGSKAIVVQAREAAAAGEKLNVLTWGGETDMAQALHDAPDIAKHVRLFTINEQDNAAFNYIESNFKGKLDMWVDNKSSYFGMWKSSWEGNYINGWHQVNADNHGALGDMFADLSVKIHGQPGVKMGDSPTVLRFLSGDQNDPTKESWGGEFMKVSDRYYTDNPAYTQYGKVGAGSISEDRSAWMGDFAARLDWLKAGSATPTPEPTPTPTPTPALTPTPPAGSITGTSGDNVLNGTSANNTLFGLAGNDILDGKAGADQMSGGAGNDAYWVDNAGDKTVEKAGEGYDWTHASVNWTLAENVEAMALRTAANINGTGNASDNFINGNSGNNVISGMAGNDILEGRGGNDTLKGDAGSDKMTGGEGTDVMYGGSDTSRDTFVFSAVSESKAGSARDIVHDFVPGVDKFDFSAMDARSSASGVQDFAFSGTAAAAHSVWMLKSGSDIILRADVSGDKTADFEILVSNASSLSSADFLF